VLIHNQGLGLRVQGLGLLVYSISVLEVDNQCLGLRV